MQYICNTYLSETFHVKHFVNTDTELQPIMVKKKEKSPRPLRSWWWFNHEEHKGCGFFCNFVKTLCACTYWISTSEK